MTMDTVTQLSLDQVFEALHYETLSDLHNLLQTPQLFAGHVRATYLPPDSPASLDPDSQEASEAATTDERRIAGAAWVWTQLSPPERQNLLEAVTHLCGTQDCTDFLETIQSRVM